MEQVWCLLPLLCLQRDLGEVQAGMDESQPHQIFILHIDLPPYFISK